MIKPIFSEKSLENAKKGIYTFKVSRDLTKFQIKSLIKEVFGVNVVKVFTLNYKGNVRRTIRGTRVSIASFKKALVTLNNDEKISLWDAPKKEKSPKKEKQKKEEK